MKKIIKRIADWYNDYTKFTVYDYIWLIVFIFLSANVQTILNYNGILRMIYYVLPALVGYRLYNLIKNMAKKK